MRKVVEFCIENYAIQYLERESGRLISAWNVNDTFHSTKGAFKFIKCVRLFQFWTKIEGKRVCSLYIISYTCIILSAVLTKFHFFIEKVTQKKSFIGISDLSLLGWVRSRDMYGLYGHGSRLIVEAIDFCTAKWQDCSHKNGFVCFILWGTQQVKKLCAIHPVLPYDFAIISQDN